MLSITAIRSTQTDIDKCKLSDSFQCLLKRNQMWNLKKVMTENK